MLPSNTAGVKCACRQFSKSKDFDCKRWFFLALASDINKYITYFSPAVVNVIVYNEQFF